MPGCRRGLAGRGRRTVRGCGCGRRILLRRGTRPAAERGRGVRRAVRVHRRDDPDRSHRAGRPGVVVLADGRRLDGCDGGRRRRARLPCAVPDRIPIASERRWIVYSHEIRERLVEPLVVAPDAASPPSHSRAAACSPVTSAPPATATVRRTGLTRSGPGSGRCSRSRVRVVPDPRRRPLRRHARTTGDSSTIVTAWAAAGFQRPRFMLAPAAGRLVSEAIAGRRDATLDHFAHDRFRSALVLETQVV